MRSGRRRIIIMSNMKCLNKEAYSRLLQGLQAHNWEEEEEEEEEEEHEDWIRSGSQIRSRRSRSKAKSGSRMATLPASQPLTHPAC